MKADISTSLRRHKNRQKQSENLFEQLDSMESDAQLKGSNEVIWTSWGSCRCYKASALVSVAYRVPKVEAKALVHVMGRPDRPVLHWFTLENE